MFKTKRRIEKWVIVVTWTNQEGKECRYRSRPMDQSEAFDESRRWSLMGHDVRVVPERQALLGNLGGLYR